MEWGILPNTVALAAVALLGYLFGRSALRNVKADPNQMRRELKRAKLVVSELERIAQEVRRSLASHHSSILHFQDRLNELSVEADGAPTQDICREAARLLRPTLELSNNMASAYDALRQQSNMLMSFTDVRTDALTGLSNRRAMDESIASLLSMMKRYRSPFAVGIFDVDHFKKVNDEFGHLYGDDVLKEVAAVMEQCVRETDILARDGGEEFVVVMPETDLQGAAIMARRIRRSVERETAVSISGGLAQAIDGDADSTLLGRADEALYAAKAAGRNCIYHHQGLEVEAVSSTQFQLAEDETAEGDAQPQVQETPMAEPQLTS